MTNISSEMAIGIILVFELIFVTKFLLHLTQADKIMLIEGTEKCKHESRLLLA